MWDWTPLRDWISGYITPYWTTPLLLAVQTLIMMISVILVMAMYTLAQQPSQRLDVKTMACSLALIKKHGASYALN